MARYSHGIVPFYPSEFSYGNSEDYGFLFLVPALAAGALAKKGVESVFGDDDDEPSVLGTVKKYWWVGLIGLPVAFFGINFALDSRLSPEEKAARAAKKAADKKLLEDWG